MDFIEKLKGEIKRYGRMDDLLDEHYNEEEYEEIYESIDFVETLSTDERRWYVMEENVYKVNINNKIYYFGVWEVGMLKSECMNVEDTCEKMEMFEVEKIVKETFKRKD